MTVTVKHPFVSTVPDSTDTSLVRPSNWNADHTIIGLGTAAELNAGVANGVATLDSGGQVPLSQIPPLGDLNYQGAWNASTNTPTLASSTGTKGYYYVVSVAGSTNLNGITDWQVGDWAVFNGSVWQKIDNTDSVTSVNSKTGAVVLTYTDVGAQPAGTYVTSVGATSPVASSGGTTPTISMAAANGTTNGYLTSTDWTTFNSKQAQLVSGTNIKTVNSTSLLGSGDVSVGVTSVTGTAPVVSSGGATPAISMAAANGTTNGYLTSTDWTTFNSKGTGSVTSVAATVPSFLSVSGTPITSSGTLAITYSGTALPVANGGTGATTLTGYVKGTGTTAMTASSTIPNTDISGLGTMSTQNASSVAITGGSINGTSLGATTAGSAKVTTLDIASGLTLATLAGTSGQVLTSAGAGAVPTWSTPAGGVTLSNDTSTSSNLYPTFASATSGSASTIYTGNSNLLYKPSTGELQAQVHSSINGLTVNNATVNTTYLIPSGYNAVSAGPVTIASGVTVTIPSGSVWAIV
jgi:hypothetical protein